MDLKIGKCPVCGRNHTLIPSNNKLATPICTSCVIKELDYSNIEDADLFCRTYNYPFNPDLWIRMAKEYKQDIFKEYALFIMQEEEKGEYEAPNKELWKSLDSE